MIATEIDKISHLWLEITPRCNLNCIHCYADSAPDRVLSESLQFDNWCSIIKEASQLHCDRLQFIGGEPALHPDLANLIKYSKNCGIAAVEIYTNGTTINPRLRQVFENYEVELAFSVYAAEEQLHDKITTVSGSQKKTLDSIEWALGIGLSVRVGIIRMTANAECVESTRNMLRKMGVQHIGVDSVRGIGRGKAILNRDIAEPMRELCGRCAEKRICITSKGEVYPCVFARFYPIGNALNGLRNILNSAQMNNFRDELQRSRIFRCEEESDDDSSCNPDRSSPCTPDDRCGPDISCRPDAQCQPIECSPQKSGEEDN